LPGAAITITGTNFIGATTIAFTGASTTTFTVNATGTVITATVPTGSTTGPVSVTNGIGTTASSTSFTVIGPPAQLAFTTQPSGTAQSASITPAPQVVVEDGAGNIVPNATTLITLAIGNDPSGAILGGGTALAAVAGVASFPAVNVPTEGIGYTLVAGALGLSSVTSAAFIVTPISAPTFASTPFAPAVALPGTSITITGTNFIGATTIAFTGASTTTFTVNASGTVITVTVPTIATTGPVTVTNGIGTTASSSPFTVLTQTVITGLVPNQGSVGTGVAISGAGFSGATAVSFSGTSAIFTVVSDTQLTTMVPTGATTGPIVVTAPGGIATSATFTVVTSSAPVIISISPAAGAPGAVVTITGINLVGVSAVSFNGTYADFSVNGAGTQITAIIPSGANSGLITVYTPQGDATSSTPFTNTTPQGSTTTSSVSTDKKCGNGIGALIGLLLLTAVLRRLRLRDQP
jgi:hypothetical protein